MTRIGRTLGVLGLFGLLSIVQTWPLAEAPARRLQAGADVIPGVWSLTEQARQLLRDPRHPMDGNIFYPYPHTLALLDHQIADAVLAMPFVAAGANSAQTYNLIVILTFVLSGVFMYLLVRALTGSTTAGLVAGCAFAFGSYRAGHLMQGHLLPTQWIPLAALALHRYLDRPTSGRLIALGAAALLVALSSWHVAIIGALGLALVAIWMLARERGGFVVRAGGLAGVALVCGLALLPLGLVYADVAEHWPPRTGNGRETLETLTNLSANVAGLVAPVENSRAPYARLLRWSDRSRPGLFPGLVVVALMLPALALIGRRPDAGRAPPVLRVLHWLLLAVGLLVAAIIGAAVAGAAWLVALLRPLAPFVLLAIVLALTTLVAVRATAPGERRRALVLTYATVAAAGALFALGPRVSIGAVDAGAGPWRFDLLPIRLIIRAPERLSLLLVFGSAVLAGLGTARLLEGRSRWTRTIAAVGLLVLINGDLAFTMTNLRPVKAPTQADRWLADLPETGAVVDYPLHWTNIWTLYSSQQYGRRTVNGTGYLVPSAYTALEDRPDLSREQLDLLWEHFHPRFVLIRSDIYDEDDRARVLASAAAQPEALRMRVRFGDEYVYELVDRGRGPLLHRFWPRRELEDRQALVLTASVTAGRTDTIGELVVTLNGRPLLLESGPSVESAREYRLRFHTDDLVAGINDFVIRADYRLADTADRPAIGTTGVTVPADVEVEADRTFTTIRINGRPIEGSRGYALVVLDPATGDVADVRLFDVAQDVFAADALADFIDTIPDGTPVVVASEFDAGRLMTDRGIAALGRLGLTADLRGAFQEMHAGIGVKGAAPGTALETIDRQTARLSLGTVDRRVVQIERLEIR